MATWWISSLLFRDPRTTGVGRARIPAQALPTRPATKATASGRLSPQATNARWRIPATMGMILAMRAPKRWRTPRRVAATPPDRATLEIVSRRVSFELWEETGKPVGDLLTWGNSIDSAPLDTLREGILAGFLGGPWLGDYPQYVWHRTGDTVHEFRLTDRRLGRYTGYELHPSEWPEGMT
jgi:hypothetical protein